jgi:hypothetical protein
VGIVTNKPTAEIGRVFMIDAESVAVQRFSAYQRAALTARPDSDIVQCLRPNPNMVRYNMIERHI